jgi:hypothetical protein
MHDVHALRVVGGSSDVRLRDARRHGESVRSLARPMLALIDGIP